MSVYIPQSHATESYRDSVQCISTIQYNASLNVVTQAICSVNKNIGISSVKHTGHKGMHVVVAA